VKIGLQRPMATSRAGTSPQIPCVAPRAGLLEVPAPGTRPRAKASIYGYGRRLRATASGNWTAPNTSMRCRQSP